MRSGLAAIDLPIGAVALLAVAANCDNWATLQDFAPLRNSIAIDAIVQYLQLLLDRGLMRRCEGTRCYHYRATPEGMSALQGFLHPVGNSMEIRA